MNNDANTCVLAEWYYGEFKGCDNLVYITNSTGYGAGIMVNGTLLQGPSDTSGEIGYLVLDPNCSFEYGGIRGSQEGYLGGMATAQRLQRDIAKQGLTTRILDHAGGTISDINFESFVAAVREGDAFCRGTVGGVHRTHGAGFRHSVTNIKSGGHCAGHHCHPYRRPAAGPGS